MFKTKFVISITIFISFLLITSIIKNKTRVIEKKILNLNTQVLIKENNLNEAQLEYFYLTSPSEIEKKLNLLGFNKYQPIKHSNIYFKLADFTEIQKNISNLKK